MKPRARKINNVWRVTFKDYEIFDIDRDHRPGPDPHSFHARFCRKYFPGNASHPDVYWNGALDGYGATLDGAEGSRRKRVEGRRTKDLEENARRTVL